MSVVSALYLTQMPSHPLSSFPAHCPSYPQTQPNPRLPLMPYTNDRWCLSVATTGCYIQHTYYLGSWALTSLALLHVCFLHWIIILCYDCHQSIPFFLLSCRCKLMQKVNVSIRKTPHSSLPVPLSLMCQWNTLQLACRMHAVVTHVNNTSTISSMN